MYFTACTFFPGKKKYTMYDLTYIKSENHQCLSMLLEFRNELPSVGLGHEGTLCDSDDTLLLELGSEISVHL